MPKEAVRGERIPQFDAEIPDEGPVTSDEYDQCEPIVEVRWSRWPDSHVQVVSRLRGYEVFVPEGEEPIPCMYGLFVTLERDAINKLIRHLRRARDQAFGRDE
jgi:hypothetical protein